MAQGGENENLPASEHELEERDILKTLLSRFNREVLKLDDHMQDSSKYKEVTNVKEKLDEDFEICIAKCEDFVEHSEDKGEAEVTEAKEMCDYLANRKARADKDYAVFLENMNKKNGDERSMKSLSRSSSRRSGRAGSAASSASSKAKREAKLAQLRANREKEKAQLHVPSTGVTLNSRGTLNIRVL